jgi:transposase-like protein
MARVGLHYCNDCKGQFTVTVGTVFERSKVPRTFSPDQQRSGDDRYRSA